MSAAPSTVSLKHAHRDLRALAHPIREKRSPVNHGNAHIETGQAERSVRSLCSAVQIDSAWFLVPGLPNLEWSSAEKNRDHEDNRTAVIERRGLDLRVSNVSRKQRDLRHIQ